MSQRLLKHQTLQLRPVAHWHTVWKAEYKTTGDVQLMQLRQPQDAAAQWPAEYSTDIRDAVLRCCRMQVE